MLYKYPQRAFPYTLLVEENRRRGKDMLEFEILDTDAFDENRYFDVLIEYAKDSPEDILMFVECPTGSGKFLTLQRTAAELSRRLLKIFIPDKDSLRPVYGHHHRLSTDPHFCDHFNFYEYFDGDTGRGIGASHQTGWTGLVAKLIQQTNQ